MSENEKNIPEGGKLADEQLEGIAGGAQYVMGDMVMNCSALGTAEAENEKFKDYYHYGLNPGQKCPKFQLKPGGGDGTLMADKTAEHCYNCVFFAMN